MIVKFSKNELVWKEGQGYSGPGKVVSFFMLDNGQVRYNVAHKIEHGVGEFIHIYSENQLDYISNHIP